MTSAFSLQLLESFGPILLAVAAALAFAAFRLYAARPDGSGGWALLALRSVALAVLVFLLLDPVLSLFSDRTSPPRVALLVDGSLSMAIPFPEDEADPDPPTRADRVRLLLEPDGGDLLDDLGDRGRLEAFRFGAGLEPLGEDLPAAMTPRDDRTDLARALSDGLAGERRRTSAIVVVSDGAHNVGVDPRAEARRLGVPVFTVGIGSEEPVADLSVFDVEASSVAYLDNDVPVRARLRARGDGVDSVVVYLSEGDAVLDSVTVDLPGGGVEREVELGYRPTAEGLHRYRVWVPEREGELSDTNNEHLFAVRVLKEKIRVLLVASRPSFDFTFVKRALESDVSLNVESVILGLTEFPGRLGKKGPAYPDDYALLAAHDLVILLDVAGLSNDRAQSIRRYVRERGGALMVMGPPRAFALQDSPLAELLPVRPGRGASRGGQILARLTGSGRTHPVTRLESDPRANERLWADLPPLSSVPIFAGTAPDARVLVRGAVDGTVREELPIVATRADGRGRVLTLAGSPFWRWDLYLWGSGRDGDVFGRFLARCVRWLVSRDDLKPVSIRPAKPLFEGADRVIVEGQIFDDDFRPVPGVDVRATVRGPLGTLEEKAREISLVDLGEGRYRGTLPGLPPGDYRIEGSARLGGASLGDDRSEMTVAPFRMEFEDPAPNFALLRDVARESGGRFVPLDEAESLLDLLPLDPVTERSVREIPFVENPLLFLLLLGLLGTEWALRRRRGLP